MHIEGPQGFEDLSTALVPIIDCNGSKWLRFILAILKNEADAEDVFQEAVRRLLARNRPFPSREQVRFYLGRTIGNTALERYNSRKREQKMQVALREHLLLPAFQCSPYDCLAESERNAEREQMLQILHEGLTLLSSKQREAVRLTILESNGLSIRELGSTYGIPYSTLRHRSSEGLKRLRKFLEHGLKDRRQKSGVRSRNSIGRNHGS